MLTKAKSQEQEKQQQQPTAFLVKSQPGHNKINDQTNSRRPVKDRRSLHVIIRLLVTVILLRSVSILLLRSGHSTLCIPPFDFAQYLLSAPQPVVRAYIIPFR